MKRIGVFLLLVSFLLVSPVFSEVKETYEEDVIKTASGDLTITLIGHGTLMFAYGGKIIHADPVFREADYTQMPKADLILITHEHGDHLDPKAIQTIRTDRTQIVLTESCTKKVSGGIVMRNGEVKTVAGFKIESVPAQIAHPVIRVECQGNLGMLPPEPPETRHQPLRRERRGDRQA